ncbi:GGDEF domain-containing protein [Pantoea agglomerans]|uniref:GGDEF domain-containing protein n=3 Tax=Enterobacter agglomerans TaxID=549 RepID=UPI0032087EDD
MHLHLSDKLIHEIDSAKGLLYKTIFVYTLIVTALIFLTAAVDANKTHINLYFFVNLSTVLILAWFIKKSFNIISHATHLLTFRVGLFLLLNSTFASLAGGLRVLDKEHSSLIAAALYVPAILLIIYSFNKFISYINARYKSAIDMSLTDELTGLPNRRHLNIRLNQLESLHGAICILDLDDFKKINDTYGHEMGDKCLKHAGLALKNFTKDDVFIARSGGEEFAIIINESEEADYRGLIEKIKHTLSMSYANGVCTTVSIGVAFKSTNQTSSNTLAAADAALYDAKKSGKNRINYAMKH